MFKFWGKKKETGELVIEKVTVQSNGIALPSWEDKVRAATRDLILKDIENQVRLMLVDIALGEGTVAETKAFIKEFESVSVLDSDQAYALFGNLRKKYPAARVQFCSGGSVDSDSLYNNQYLNLQRLTKGVSVQIYNEHYGDVNEKISNNS